MPAMPLPIADERQGLRGFLAQQQEAFLAIAYGLTDEQARATPSVSALSIGGLIKHATGVQRGWMGRVAAAPEFPPADPRPLEEQMAAYADEYVMTPDDTLAELLEAFAEQNAESLRLVETADLDAAVPVPQEVPWFPKDIEAWSVRWVILHMIEELGRHAGHGDIIRESIDGATLYELIAGLEGWPETDWIKPWRKPEQPGQGVAG